MVFNILYAKHKILTIGYLVFAIVSPCRRESGTSCGSVMVPAYDPILVINLPLQLSLWENLGTDDKDF